MPTRVHDVGRRRVICIILYMSVLHWIHIANSTCLICARMGFPRKYVTPCCGRQGSSLVLASLRYRLGIALGTGASNTATRKASLATFTRMGHVSVCGIGLRPHEQDGVSVD
eukprot:3257621-Pyramimonas_sp.AAC.1